MSYTPFFSSLTLIPIAGLILEHVIAQPQFEQLDSTTRCNIQNTLCLLKSSAEQPLAKWIAALILSPAVLTVLEELRLLDRLPSLKHLRLLVADNSAEQHENLSLVKAALDNTQYAALLLMFEHCLKLYEVMKTELSQNRNGYFSADPNANSVTNNVLPFVSPTKA